MKTSNKILIAVSTIILIYLLVYDLALKAEYVKGDYKKPHYHMQQLNFSNFNAIEHNVGNIIHLKVEKGPYGVWVYDDIKDKISVSQHGQTLQVNYVGEKGNYYRMYGRSVIISCPMVTSVITHNYVEPGRESDGRYLRKNGASMLIDYYPHETTVVEGFNEATLHVEANQFTEIELKNNTLGELIATVGDKMHGQSGLTIGPDNKIAKANLQVPGKSTLTLDNLFIGNITYSFADSAQVNLTGKAAHLLKP